MTQPVSEILTKAAEIVRKGWTQHEYARDAEGRPVDPHASEATCWCVLGAIQAAAGSWSERQAAIGLVQRTVRENPWVWNDDEGCTQSEVVEALLKAAEQAKLNEGQSNG